MHISSVTPYNCSFSSGAHRASATMPTRHFSIFLIHIAYTCRGWTGKGGRERRPRRPHRYGVYIYSWNENENEHRIEWNENNGDAQKENTQRTEAHWQHDGLIAHKQFHSWTATTGNDYTATHRNNSFFFHSSLLFCECVLCVSARFQLPATGTISSLPCAPIKENSSSSSSSGHDDDDKTSCDSQLRDYNLQCSAHPSPQMEWLESNRVQKKKTTPYSFATTQRIVFICAIFVRASASTMA